MDFLEMGPIGQSKGKHWEELGRNVISHIFVYFDERSVRSISFGFIENATLVFSKYHGLCDTETCSLRTVRLKQESEFVTGLSGEWTGGLITSLTVHTNEKSHETFRSTFIFKDAITKREFHSGIHDGCEFGGFFGSCTPSRLSSIGFYIKPVIPGVNTMKHEDL